jgi:G3E family GTPase
VRRSQEDLVELTDGCVCCTVRGDLARTLTDLLRRRDRRFFARPFERLVIEASGLASPGPILQTLLVDAQLAAALEPPAVVVVASAADLEAQLARHPEAEEQLGHADRVVLNHVDRADAAALARAEQRIRAINAWAEIVRAERARVDVSWLLAPAAPRPAGAPRATDEHRHTHGAASHVLRTAAELDLGRLRMWLGFLAQQRGRELWRVKGLVRCRGEPNTLLVQGVGGWIELERDPRPTEESLLVVIGRGLDGAELERGFAACAAP